MNYLNQEKFIRLLQEKYGDKFTYEKVEYKNSNSMVTITCSKHGDFVVRAGTMIYLNGNCPKCKLEIKRNDFIRKAREVHGDKYDYSKVEYVNNHTRVCIICPEHGEFWQVPHLHLSSPTGCPNCSHCAPLNKEIFIERARKIFGNKYDYSKVEYVNTNTKVCIICPEHGEFWMIPNAHLSAKHQCPHCVHRSYKKTIQEFIFDAQEMHGDKYDYSKVEYVNNRTKVCIICPEHGEFWQTPHTHLRGNGCPRCSNNYQYNQDEFIRRASHMHHERFDYSKVEYVNTETKVCIICPEHGEFWQTPHTHLRGNGCPQCHSESNVNESKLFRYLTKYMSYDIKREYKPSWLEGLSLDMFFPDLNIAIEYQGIQHFQPVNFFGGEERFIDNIKRDKKKYQLCCENNIKLLYFTYLPKRNIPENYIDKVYTNDKELLTIIQNYGVNSRNKGPIQTC